MLEVQGHPENIRQPVRYYFLPARTVVWVAAGAVAAVGLLAGGVDARCLPLESPQGHDAFLMPIPRYLQAFGAYMKRIEV